MAYPADASASAIAAQDSTISPWQFTGSGSAEFSARAEAEGYSSAGCSSWGTAQSLFEVVFSLTEPADYQLETTLRRRYDTRAFFKLYRTADLLLDLTPADPSPLPTSELSLVHTGILPAGLYTLSIQAFVMETLLNGESVNTRASWSFSFTLSPRSVPDAGSTFGLAALALIALGVERRRGRWVT
jgi:hypothetical protein